MIIDSYQIVKKGAHVVFDADRPIQRANQDRLNRSLFAKYLARCILDHNDMYSFVVGLYGGWGVGKTSLINLTIEELNLAASNMVDQEKPIILNFSPWSYSGQNELVYSFFRRLSSALRSVPYLENADRIIHLLELYVSFFTHKPVPHALRTKRSLRDKLTFAKNEEVYAWESGRDLTLIKAELNELLRIESHKIIIIIDNISRLYPHEIKQIFQIVKSMGDYANTAYLLAFDKNQVVSAIDNVDGRGGEEFIEKVIQLPFEIPPILQQDIENIFADKLNTIILTVPEGAWSIEYWADVYYTSLKFFFENCRDITRYVNTLDFSYPRVREVVNPVDFFALTAIEIFIPDVYFGIRDNKDLFTDLLENVYVLDKEQIQKSKLRCDEILSRNQRLPREILLDLFLNLFPTLRKIYQPDLDFYYSDSLARKSRRICSPDLFDTYFRLSMQSGQILESEFETLLSLTSNPKSFNQALERLNQDGRVTKFLDLLNKNIIKQIPRENIAAIINSLLDNGDLFPQGTAGLLSMDTPMQIHRIIHGLLHRNNKTEDRFLIMQQAIAGANNSLYIIVHELEEQGREHLEEEDTFLPLEFRDLMPEQLDSLRKFTVTRIETWADQGRLSEHPLMLPILKAWHNWSNDDKCYQFVKKMTETDRGLVIFLTAILSEAITQAMTEYVINLEWKSYLQDIDVFIPPRALEEHAKILFEDQHFEQLREREQLALMIFLDLLNADTKKIIPNTSG
jgi:predicted KAP-like P-loop ATPase